MPFVIPLWLLIDVMTLLTLSGYLAGRHAAVRKLRPIIRRMRHKALREALRRPAELERENAKAMEKGRAEADATALPRMLALSEENRRLREQVRMEALLDRRIKACCVIGTQEARGKEETA